jgi:hypothetical protein
MHRCRILIHRRGTEYAEVYHFKLSLRALSASAVQYPNSYLTTQNPEVPYLDFIHTSQPDGAFG